jgi:amino acid transporter
MSREAKHDGRRATLRATLTLPALAAYAIGDILGAGIYALVGKVAAVCGPALWVAFVVSAVVALLTGFAYAELASRFPRSAGAALYCRRGFRHPLPAFVVGIFVLMSGLNSAAAVSRALIGYVHEFVAAPEIAVSLTFLVAVSCLNFWGIEESSRVNVVLTALEVTGLLLVIVAGVVAARSLSGAEAFGRLAVGPGELRNVLPATTIAFFAFIGFEDVANVVEEARDPRRALPRAIVIAIVFTTIVYVAVGIAALLAVPVATLADSAAPLAAVVEASGIPIPGRLFAAIAIVAIANTGLLNLIMAARLSYGMAREGLLPAILGEVHAVRRTPSVAVALVFGLTALLSLTGGVQVLAQSTSALLVIVFLLVHVSLVLVKRRERAAPADAFTVPAAVPVAGAASCLWLLAQYPTEVYARAAAVAVVALALYVIAGRFGLRAGEPRGRA